MKKLLFVLPMTFIMIFLSACSLNHIISIYDFFSESDEAGGVQVIQSGESSLSMEFPDSWKPEDLNDEASIQMAYLLKEQYIAVLEEPVIDFDEDVTLDDYTSIIRMNMFENSEVEVIDSSEIKDTKINGNIDAKQFEMSASVDRIKVKYFFTCIEANGIFYQFIAWSVPSKYDAAYPVFEKILDSVAFYEALSTSGNK